MGTDYIQLKQNINKHFLTIQHIHDYAFYIHTYNFYKINYEMIVAK